MFNSNRWERFEEEASARAAREAESEAKKALWRAEEAQVRICDWLLCVCGKRSSAGLE